MKAGMKLVYFGSGAFGLPTLEALAHEHRVVCVVTQPDRPAGRGGKLTPTPIGAYAAERLPEVPLLKPEKVNATEIVSQVRGCGADAWVVIAFGQKLGKALLDGVFAINLHASLLPRWRGAAPINAAILGGDAESGNSVITLADRMDAGLVLGQSRRPIVDTQTAGELHDLLASDGPSLVLDVLARHRSGSLEPIVQDETLVTLAKKLSKDDGVLDFSRPADASVRTIHGLTPWPGVAVRIEGVDTDVKLLRVGTLVPSAASCTKFSGPPGTLVDTDEGVIACTGGTGLRLLHVQPAGKRPMSWQDFMRGRAVKPGALVRSVREASA